MVTYDPKLLPLKQTTYKTIQQTIYMYKHLPILSVSPTMKDILSRPPLMAFSCHPNLSNMLVRTRMDSTRCTYWGNSQCNQSRCKTCKHICPTDSFNSCVTCQEFILRATVTCKTKNMVYLIQCTKRTNNMWGKQKPPSTYV